MFTGLIEAVCKVKSANIASGRLSVDLDSSANDVGLGESIAVNGVCLTVTGLNASLADFDVSPETVEKTTVGLLQAGSAVNIERALKPADRFGGHFVQGHVDGIALINKIEQRGDFRNIKFTAGDELLGRMVIKGSVAIDGVSLTIADMNGRSFSAAVIPETLRRTTLGSAKVGDKVNVETDIIVKAVKKQLDKLYRSG